MEEEVCFLQQHKTGRNGEQEIGEEGKGNALQMSGWMIVLPLGFI